MGLANFRIANADNKQDSVGASWTFPVGVAPSLPPHAKTPPRILRFTFTGGVPAEPEGYFEPAFRIFARDDRAGVPSSTPSPDSICGAAGTQ
jgi:hypothetical protein